MLIVHRLTCGLSNIVICKLVAHNWANENIRMFLLEGEGVNEGHKKRLHFLEASVFEKQVLPGSGRRQKSLVISIQQFNTNNRNFKLKERRRTCVPTYCGVTVSRCTVPRTVSRTALLWVPDFFNLVLLDMRRKPKDALAF